MTKIEWVNKSENFGIAGCTHNCPYCYANTMSRRQACIRASRYLIEQGIPYKHLPVEERMKMYRSTPVWCQDCWDFKPHLHGRIEDVKLLNTPKSYFIDSMWDFNCKDNKPEWMEAIIEKMREYPQHTFLILSKNPIGYKRFNFPDSVWLGTTITCQADVWRLTDLALSNGTHKKFVSVEPFKGSLLADFSNVDWVIIGAETGSNKDRVVPEKAWVDFLILQARTKPIFLKDNLKWPEKIQEFPKT